MEVLDIVSISTVVAAVGVAIGVVFFLLETVLINSGIEKFPATVLVIAGWLTALGIRYVYKPSIGTE